jgi:hypothetical protein
MKKTKDSFFGYIKSHKIISTILVLVLISIGYYFYSSKFNNSSQPSYIVTNAKRGNIVKSVTGTGTGFKAFEDLAEEEIQEDPGNITELEIGSEIIERKESEE